jgi:hypothetical protein
MLLLFPIMIDMPRENNYDYDEEAEAAFWDIDKDIQKGMDRYEARIKSAAEGEAAPAGDSRGLKNKLDGS